MRTVHLSIVLVLLPSLGSRCNLDWPSAKHCAAGTYRHPGGECVPVTQCNAEQYEVKPPSPTRDRRCKALTVCTEAQYELEPPSPTRDRSCEALSTCSPEEYESAPPTKTSDRECTARTVCEPGEHTASAGTETTDATCELCSVGTYCEGGSASAVRCDWRDSDCDPSTPCVEVVQLSAASGYTCALDGAGKVTCWGSNDAGQAVVPPDNLGRIVQVSGGTYETCAVNEAGEAPCWGHIPAPFSRRQRPEDPSSIVQVSGGHIHTCTLDDAGRVVCWGFCSPGECDPPEGLGAVIQIATGSSFTCGLDAEGLVTCWGEHSNGRIDVPSDLANVVQIDAGSLHGCALDAEGGVTCWGDDSYGQRTVPPDLGTIVQVTAGWNHTCALRENGEVSCWGDDQYGQSRVPQGLGRIVQLSAGAAHTCAADDAGAVQCWGSAEDPPVCPANCEPPSGQECAVTAKRLEVFVEDALLRPDLGEVLRGYVEDINAVFAKTTSRRFEFDPARDLHMWAADARPDACAGSHSIDDDYSYALVIAKNRSAFPLSHGGNGGCNRPNQLVATGFEWTTFFSRAEVPANADEYYRRQLHAVVHELGHMHGLALGEYYTLATMIDDTGVPPDLDVASHTTPDLDPYWGPRLGLLDDPMLSAGSDPLTYMARARFGGLSSFLINTTVAYAIPNPPPDPTQPFFNFFGLHMVPDDASVRVHVSDQLTGERLPGCDVTVFNIDLPNTAGNLLITSGTSDATGTFAFDWGNGNLHSSFNLARLIKASCPGYAPTGQWLSVFDLQAAIHMPNGGDTGDFHYHDAVELSAVRN